MHHDQAVAQISAALQSKGLPQQIAISRADELLIEAAKEASAIKPYPSEKPVKKKAAKKKAKKK